MMPILRAARAATACVLLGAGFLSCAAPSTESRSQPAPRSTKTVKPPRQWDLAWARRAVFYQIFVRSFADSDGDGIGDLRGLTSKLDYLNDGDPATRSDLGVEGLWLMPIFASPSYHGYDVTDYERINPDYGNLEDFRHLCREAHRRGIRIILDLVLNHTSSEHPWFKAAAASASSPRRRWYLWRPDNPGWTQPWGSGPTWHRNPRDGWYYYGLFWGGMPDLNFDTAEVRAEVKRLAALWLDRGADGFRLDAARHLFASGPGNGQADDPRTHAFWREFAVWVRERYPRALLVGENWTETQKIAAYYGSTARVKAGDELPLSFNFPLAEAVIAALDEGDGRRIVETYRKMARHYPAGVMDAPFLTNHDQVRVATKLGGDRSKLANAASLLLTLPGTPFLYYGEEIGLPNGGPGGDDQLKRTPMPWTTAPGRGFTTGTPWYPFAPGEAVVSEQSRDPGSLLARYRELIQLRTATPALREGDLRLLAGTAALPALAFLRRAGDDEVLVVHNLTDERVEVGPIDAAGQPAKLFVDSGAKGPVGAAGAWRLSLPARSTGIWRVLRN